MPNGQAFVPYDCGVVVYGVIVLKGWEHFTTRAGKFEGHAGTATRVQQDVSIYERGFWK